MNLSVIKNKESKDEPQTLTSQPVQPDPIEKPTPQASPPEPQLNFELSAQFKHEMSMSHLPEEYREQSRVVAVATATSLYNEGIPAAVRALARDIALRQQAVHQADSLVALFRQRARTETGFDMKRLQVAERSADGEHGRLIKAIDTYERLMRPIAPALRLNGPNFVQYNDNKEG